MESLKVISKDGASIVFDKTGKGPVILLVNGAMGYRGYRGEALLAAELSTTYTVISYDRRGRGESGDAKSYTVEKEMEDIEALINTSGESVFLYGFSSGAVLALKAASKLGNKISKLILHEPPFGADDDKSKQEFFEYTEQMNRLLASNDRNGAVSFFLSDMLPPDMIEGIQQTPDWKKMEGVAHTLAYDNALMGDGSVPVADAKSVTAKTMVLVGSDSPEFKHDAAVMLAKVLANAQVKKLEGQNTIVSPELLAPVLMGFFK